MCMLVMALIPAAAGISDKQAPQQSDVGRTWIWGLIMNYKDVGRTFTFRAVFVRFVTIGIGEHYSGGLHFLEKLELKHTLFTGAVIRGRIILGQFAGELVIR